MSRSGAIDPDVVLDRDEAGDRLLLAVESRSIKLVVMVPDGVSRSKLETAATDWVRELANRVDTATGDDGIETATDDTETKATDAVTTATNDDGTEAASGNEGAIERPREDERAGPRDGAVRMSSEQRRSDEARQENGETPPERL